MTSTAPLFNIVAPTDAGTTAVVADLDSPDLVPRFAESYFSASVSAAAGILTVSLVLLDSLGLGLISIC
jgi:hypothetical protein